MPAKQTRVDVVGKDVVLQIADHDMKHALRCLEKNGEIKFRYAEVRVREFPGSMSFEPKAAHPRDGGDSGGDSGGGGNDID